ncbi:MAG: NusG domain II-containing protein [Clostridia bacterium]|nr:NusG domain II-containing protein [Clostridia bacterium]MBQ3155864.1 NusG domain II-containing protein [Clostridia bacterium]MBQ7139476.1 NusG domain II-containing protein [Clostridia bacterium]
MDKKNFLVIGLILIAAAALFAWSTLARPMPAAEENQVIITVDGKEYKRIPLSQPQTVTVRQADGCVNTVEVTERGAVMQSSTCGNQLCVKMGEVTVDNWEFRPNQQFIICLPNRVSVELAVTE